MPLHLIKLSVGPKSLAELRLRQSQHSAVHGRLHHRTRNFPRRAPEILDGGSIYWVIDRVLTARQRILAIEIARRDDGTRCTDLILLPELVPVQARLMKPFQGWRYLGAADAPTDLAACNATTALPEALRRELAALALI